MAACAVLLLLLQSHLLAVPLSVVSPQPTPAGSPVAAAAPSAAGLPPVPVPEPSEKALRYYRGNLVWWGGRVAWGLVVPGIILFSGFSARLRDCARRIGRKWFVTVGLYVCLLAGVFWLVSLPLDYWQGYVREHAYGLSNQTLGKWFGDSLKSLMVVMVFGFAFVWLPYRLLRAFPRGWWLVTSALAVPVIVLVVLIEPIWIAPLFNEFRPMRDQALERDILALARRAGIEGSRVFEVNKSVDTKAVNAYMAGLFDTKRIVLWDTLIARLDRDETLFVMGHEMGHYVLGHVWKIMAAACLLVGLTLYAIHRAAGKLIAWFKLRLGFDELSDVASLPLLLLFFQISSLALLPFINGYSRHLEHEADRFGLEITRSNHAAATAFVKLQQENLGNPRPGLIYRIWQASHPVLADRIEFCNTYAPWRTGQPLRYADHF